MRSLHFDGDVASLDLCTASFRGELDLRAESALEISSVVSPELSQSPPNASQQTALHSMLLHSLPCALITFWSTVVVFEEHQLVEDRTADLCTSSVSGAAVDGTSTNNSSSTATRYHSLHCNMLEPKHLL